MAIVAAQWNPEITKALADGAERAARAAGATVERFEVAGSFELPAAVAYLAKGTGLDAIVPVGCLIRGDTPHFDVLARAVADGIMSLSIQYTNVAISFGILTCETVEQARDRAGGRQGNKGEEAMDAALSLVALRQAIESRADRSAR